MSRALEVLRPGPLATVQDLGRPGCADLGVGQSGAADRRSLRLANRMVGNDEDAAGLEVTFGGLVVRAHGDLTLCLTGAVTPARVGSREAACNAVVVLRDGQVLTLGQPTTGLRTYLAVRGGVDVPVVLGSRSTDVLAGLGPDVLAPGRCLPVGARTAGLPVLDVAPVAAPPAGEVRLGVALGPRHDWFTAEAVRTLLSAPWRVSEQSNRVGMRLAGPRLPRSRDEELPSEGMVRGALQVPAAGTPILFLADHPVTGGYPVVAVVRDSDVDRAAQVRPGQPVRFCLVRPAPRLGATAAWSRS